MDSSFRGRPDKNVIPERTTLLTANEFLLVQMLRTTGLDRFVIRSDQPKWLVDEASVNQPLRLDEELMRNRLQMTAKMCTAHLKI